MRHFGSFKILPVLIIVAAISFGIRFGDIVEQLASGKAYAALGDISPSAGGDDAPSASELKAADETPEEAAKKAEAAKEEAKAATQADKTDVTAKPEIEAPSLGEPPKASWKGPDDLDDEYSDVKMELFSDLAKRRKDLDGKEKELAMREALLKAAQAEIEQKTQELNGIKTDIESLLTKQNDQEEKRIASLVKIYEGMKAKDAARIFNSLDMDVLLQVVTKMSERKTAPIIAAMDADKARNLTIMLAEQNKLPSIPALPGSLDSPPQTATP